MLHTKRIEVILTDEEMRFIEWMARRDRVSVNTALRACFWSDFDNCKMLYMDEMKMEEENG